MRQGEDTCWTMIQRAAAGEPGDRETFARIYEPVVRAYLAARWRGGARLQEIDDAVQEVFVDCLRPHGALERYDPAKGPSFRAFLYGAVRNVALRVEQRRGRSKEHQAKTSVAMRVQPADEESLATAFDRSWARALLREAGARQRAQAARRGAAGLERVRLLQLRFQDGMPIREIARRWDTDAARLHHVYATARKEFRRCLEHLVGFHHPAAEADEVKQECRKLLELIP